MKARKKTQINKKEVPHVATNISIFVTKWLGESCVSKQFNHPSLLFSQGFPVQQYGSGAMSGYPNQPLQYPSGPQQRCVPSPSYPSSRMPLMSQYTAGSHNPTQFPPGGGQPNPPQYYKVISSIAVLSQIRHWVLQANSNIPKSQLLLIY